MAAGPGQGVSWRLGKDADRKQPSELPFEGGKKPNLPGAQPSPLISFPSGPALFTREASSGAGGGEGRPGAARGGRPASPRNTSL